MSIGASGFSDWSLFQGKETNAAHAVLAARFLRAKTPYPRSKCADPKLTVVQVTQIREEYVATPISQTALGAKYGVSRMTVSQVVRGQTWATSPGPTLSKRATLGTRLQARREVRDAAQA